MLESLYNGYKVRLVENLDDLAFVKSTLNPKIRVGIDTETKSLTYAEEQIAGVCLACGQSYRKEDYAGYYLPLRHLCGHNLPLKDVVDFVQFIIDNYVTILWNRTFDMFQLEFEGIKVPFTGKTHDAQIMAHLAFSESLPALKPTAHNVLHFDVMDFESNAAKNHDFTTTDPTVSYKYAAQDPLITVLLAIKLWNEYPYIRKIYPLDNIAGEAVRQLCKSEIHLDYKIIRGVLLEEEKKLASIKAQIFGITGYQFNLNSTVDKADALGRFVTLTKKTDKGKLAVNAEALEEVDHPLAKMFIDYAEVNKYINTYLKKMLSWESLDRPLRINYSACNALTGRLSSGGARLNSYFVNFNAQNVPKTQFTGFVHRDDVLGYIISQDEEGSIGTAEYKGGIREAFGPPEGYVWASADYSQEELRLAGNFSHEPMLLNPIKEGKDIHMFIAKTMFGYEDKKHRTHTKIVNFSVIYGATKYTLAKKLNMAVEKAGEFLDHYYKVLCKLKSWKESVIKEGRRKGIVFTYFGRPRLLYKYYTSSDRSLHGYADRTSPSHICQGCLPIDSFLTLDDRISKFSSVLMQRLSQNGHQVVPSHRGKFQLCRVVFKSGDFIICDVNHKLIKEEDGRKFAVSIFNTFNDKMMLAKLKRKSLLVNMSLFKYSAKTAVSLLKLTVQKTTVNAGNKKLNSLIWKIFLARKSFKVDSQIEAANLRSLFDLYGFNMVYVGHSKYKIKSSRCKKSKLDYVAPLFEKSEVACCTAMNGFQTYEAQGVVNKNTGGDIIRMDLSKFFKLRETNKEFADNVIIATTIHDEICFYVKPSYLYKLYQYVLKIMTYQPDNFEVPLVVSFGVGKNWGTCLDVDYVTEDNKCHIKEFENV